MGDLLIRNVSGAIKDRLAEEAKQGGRSLSDEAKMRLARSLAEEEAEPDKKQSAWVALRRSVLEADALMSDEEHAEFMRVVEESRKDFGRPLPDFE